MTDATTARATGVTMTTNDCNGFADKLAEMGYHTSPRNIRAVTGGFTHLYYMEMGAESARILVKGLLLEALAESNDLLTVFDLASDRYVTLNDWVTGTGYFVADFSELLEF